MFSLAPYVFKGSGGLRYIWDIDMEHYIDLLFFEHLEKMKSREFFLQGKLGATMFKATRSN